MNDLNFLNPRDAYAVATALLYALRVQPQYSVISELPYLLDYDSFIKFIKYYGGQTIRVPTLEEMSEVFKLMLLYQYHEVDTLDWKTSLKKSGYRDEDSWSVKAKLQILKKILKDQDFGGRDYE